MENKNEERILKEIEKKNEKDIDINYELLENRKTELSGFRKKRMHGVFYKIQS